MSEIDTTETKHIDLSPRERFWLWVMRTNASEKKKQIKKTVHMGRLSITWKWRSKRNVWGRFGGGWNWKLGFQSGGHTIIVHLLISSLRFSLESSHE